MGESEAEESFENISLKKSYVHSESFLYVYVLSLSVQSYLINVLVENVRVHLEFVDSDCKRVLKKRSV